ncbi:MAG: hypothetical protein K8J31_05775, partial [Anaerolineae bacterium]|nr:hypothetical protein [Anaerolineae bacterium]
KAAIAGQPLNYEPPTDENPYFFNMLRLDHLDRALASGQGALSGNLIASLTLIGLIFSLAILAIITIVLPLWIKSRTQDQHPPPFWAGALYFSLIGAGFMFVEIGLLQRLSVFLSHPIYALGVLLFTIIASTGVGSFFSERLSLDRIPWIYVYPTVTTMMILTLRFILPPLISNLITIPIPIKIAISVIVIFPMGILMGLFFPTGMRLARASYATETPWYWALNGIFGVLCSALGVFVAIYIGISANFDIAALCYAGVLLALHQMHRIAQERAKSLTMTAKGETVEAEA